jgi:ABC-type antimicrobial peptide transport system permease subunit
MVLSKLAISNFLAHRVRLALTVAAIALSVSLVVAVTSGYASAESAAEQFLSRFIGTVDAEVTRQNDNRGAIERRSSRHRGRSRMSSASLSPRDRAEPRPAHVDPRHHSRAAQISGIRGRQDKRAIACRWSKGSGSSAMTVTLPSSIRSRPTC